MAEKKKGGAKAEAVDVASMAESIEDAVEKAAAEKPAAKAPAKVSKADFEARIVEALGGDAKVIRIVGPSDAVPENPEELRLTMEAMKRRLEMSGAELLASTDAGLVYLIDGKLIVKEGLPSGVHEAELLPPRPDPNYVHPAKRIVTLCDPAWGNPGQVC